LKGHEGRYVAVIENHMFIGANTITLDYFDETEAQIRGTRKEHTHGWRQPGPAKGGYERYIVPGPSRYGARES